MVSAGGGRDAGVMQAQQNGDGTPQRPQNPLHPGTMPSDDISGLPDSPISASTREQLRKALNDDRHKRLENDVAKLQTLTSELKTDVDKANKDELSLDVMRKAAEIEKLAHDVQSRMKD
jgi:hypothetical protein